jgi:uncharacterized membrane protein
MLIARKMIKWSQLFRNNRLFLIFLLCWTALFFGLRTVQHLSFGTNTYDLSIYDYMMSYTLQGEFMPEPFHGYWGSHFAMHATPILFLLVPFYLLFDGPLFLLYIQVLAGALSALVLYIIAKQVLGGKYIPALIAIIFLLYRPFLNVLMFDFHPEIFFPLLLFSAYYFIAIKKRLLLYFIFITLALFIKEDIPIFLFFFGIFLFIKLKEDKKIGLITSGTAILYFILVLEFVIPHFRDQVGIGRKFEYYGLWGDLGNNIFEVAKNFILNAPSILASLPWGEIGSSLFNIFAALLFIPLFSPFILLAVPPIGILASSQSPVMHGFGLHYFANILPFLFLAFVYGLKNIGVRLNRRKKSKKIFVAICVSICLITLANTKWELLKPSRYSGLEDYKALKKVIESIPRDTSVASLSSIIPHIPKRKNIVMLPQTADAEFILVHSGLNHWPFSEEEFARFLENLESDENYVCILSDDRIQLFRKNPID